MPAPRYVSAASGGQATAAGIDQFLVSHGTRLHYAGVAQVSNLLAVASSPAVWNGQWWAQPFVQVGTEIDRVTIQGSIAGAGNDCTVSLQLDSAGSPSGIDIVSCTVPADFLSGVVRSLSVPLFAAGLTAGLTYYVVLKSTAPAAANAFAAGVTATSGTLIKSSTNQGGTWANGTTSLWFTVFATYVGQLINVSEDVGTPTAKWTELIYNVNGQLVTLNEIAGVARAHLTLTYDPNGALASLS